MTSREAVGTLTTVMYHFVQPRDAGPVQGLKALDVSAFRGQLAYIRAHYSPIGLADLVAAVDTGVPLPPRAILLTFDDGYRCHCEEVLPILEAHQMTAVFFPVAAASLDGRVLDVNKIQCVLAVTRDMSALVRDVESAVEEARGAVDVPAVADLRARWWKRSRWDEEPVVYVKQLLQHALPDAIRRPLVDALFAARISADEQSFARDLYMTADELRTLRERGMAIGAHGDRHLRLPTLTGDDQRREIDGALRVLDAVGIARTRFAYCYANGAHDARSVELLRARGCAVAFTTEPDLAHRVAADPLTLPRLDANDLPAEAAAPPNEWTRLAAEPS